MASRKAEILYELGPHGLGWRFELTSEAGWSDAREATDNQDTEERRSPGGMFLPKRLLAAWNAIQQRAPTLLSQFTGSSLCRAHDLFLYEMPHWRFALGANSELLALWRWHELCLFSPRDNFAQPISSWTSPVDSAPHRRMLGWNGDGTLLAAATSDGVIFVFDSRLRPLHALPALWWSNADAGVLSPDVSLHDPASTRSASLAALAWREPPISAASYSELLLLESTGVLHRIAVPLPCSTAAGGATLSRSAAPPLQLDGQATPNHPAPSSLNSLPTLRPSHSCRPLSPEPTANNT